MISQDNNAPGPEVMREEMINLTVSKSGGKISRHKAEQIVDGILQKQMNFYSHMAAAEADTSGVEAAVIIAALPGRVDAVIRQGAEVVQFMTPHNQGRWRMSVELLRDTVRQIIDLVG